MLTRRHTLKSAAAGTAGLLGTDSTGQETNAQDTSTVQNSSQASNVKPSNEGNDGWPLVNKNLEQSSRDPRSGVPVENINAILETGGEFGKRSHVLANKDKIVVGGGNVEAYDRQTGKKLWTFEEGGVRRPPAIGNNKVYFTAIDGTVYAVDENGNKASESAVSSTAGMYTVDGNVLAVSGIGEVNLFDENLGQRATYDRPGDVTIPSKNTVIDDKGRAIYIEAEQGDGTDTHLRMLDLRDPTETDSLEELDKVPVSGNAENGAVLHDGVFYWSEGDRLKGYEIQGDEFSDEEVLSVDVGRSEVSPVPYGDWLIDGNRKGEVYAVNIESGEVVDIDSFGTGVRSLAAGENSFVISEDGYTSRVYDFEEAFSGNAEPVETFTKGDDKPIGYNNVAAILDDKVVMDDLDANSGKISVKVLDGDYRSEDPPPLYGNLKPPKDPDGDGLYENLDSARL